VKLTFELILLITFMLILDLWWNYLFMNICCLDLFGTVITQELGEGGADRLVTREDAQEYVDRSVHCDHPGAG